MQAAMRSTRVAAAGWAGALFYLASVVETYGEERRTLDEARRETAMKRAAAYATRTPGGGWVAGPPEPGQIPIMTSRGPLLVDENEGRAQGRTVTVFFRYIPPDE